MTLSRFVIQSLFFGLFMAGATLLFDYREGKELEAGNIGQTLLIWLVAGFVITWLNDRSASYLERKNAQWKAKSERKRQEGAEAKLKEMRRQ